MNAILLPMTKVDITFKLSRALSDQDLNQIVVKRPPGLMANCTGKNDQAHRFIDHHSCAGQRVAALVARDDDRKFRAHEGSPPLLYAALSLTLDLEYLVACMGTILHHLATDPGGRGSSQVRS